VTFNYTGTCIVGIDGANGGNTACPTSSVHQVVKKGEAYVKFSAKDTTGRKIGLTQFTPGAYADTSKAYCGGITKAQKVKAGAKWSLATLGNPTCESLPTTGTITIVFSNQP
jgi:hypothetical protein